MSGLFKVRVRANGGLNLPVVTSETTPVGGETSVYFKLDNKLYSKNSSGVETLIGPSAALTSSRFVGEVTMFYGNKANIPSDWLAMDGSTFSGTTYPALQTLLGSTTLPNMSDRVPVGASGTKAVRTTGGSATSLIGAANLPPHTHAVSLSGGAHKHTLRFSDAAGVSTQNIPKGTGAYSNQNSTPVVEPDGSQAGVVGDHTHSGNTGEAYTGAAVELSVQNPYVAMWYIIRAVA